MTDTSETGRTLTLTPELLADLEAVLEYAGMDEEDDYEQQDDEGREIHVLPKIERLNAWLAREHQPAPPRTWAYIQQGGASGEYYVHAFDSRADAEAGRIDCARGAYRTTHVVEMPHLTREQLSAVEELVQGIDDLDYPDYEDNDDDSEDDDPPPTILTDNLVSRQIGGGAEEVFDIAAYRGFHPDADIRTCGACNRSWDDAITTGVTPTPAARCPFEYEHKER